MDTSDLSWEAFLEAVCKNVFDSGRYEDFKNYAVAGRRLIEQGADVNFVKSVGTEDGGSCEYSWLHFCVMLGDLSDVEFALLHGADPFQGDGCEDHDAFTLAKLNRLGGVQRMLLAHVVDPVQRRAVATAMRLGPTGRAPDAADVAYTAAIA